MTTLTRAAIVGMATMLLLIAACTPTAPGAMQSPAQTAPTASPAPSPTPAPTATPPTSPAAPTALVRVEQVGGMMPVWEALRFYPQLVLYSDGRLMTQGPVIAIYPGPALPNIQVTHISQAGVAQIMQWAAEAGLQGEDRTLGEPSFDAGQTVFTVVTDEGTHTTAVWDMMAGDPAVGALREFQEVVLNPRQWLGGEVIGDDEPYTWDRLRVVSFATNAIDLPEPDLTTVMEWPLEPIAGRGVAIDDEGTYSCWSLEGEDALGMRPLLERANTLTLWRSEDVTYQAYFRPLLPDEEACPGL